MSILYWRVSVSIKWIYNHTSHHVFNVQWNPSSPDALGTIQNVRFRGDLVLKGLMGDYRYTELSHKISSLNYRTCCLGSFGLTYAGVMSFICDSYRNVTNPFNTFQLSVPVAVNITWDTCRKSRFGTTGHVHYL